MDTLQQNIIRALGFEDVPVGEQEELMESVGQVIYEGVLIRAMRILTEKERIEFEILLDDEVSSQHLIEFLEEKIPEFGKLVKEEVDEYQKEVGIIKEGMLKGE